MISRRTASLQFLAAPFVLHPWIARAQTADGVIGEEATFEQLTLPTVEALDDPVLYGYKPATQAQIEKAQKIIETTPKGPTPFDVAKSFVDRFAKSDPEAISQWPAPDTWNPLVKEFFAATSLRANNDMINWCAAFANWCIERNNRRGTNSAASQSFITSGMFQKTTQPKPGNLVVFTCYDKQSGKSLGLGHVAFFAGSVAGNKIRVIGGNQSADGHKSIISERDFLTTPFDVHRHVGAEYVPCLFKLNSYLVLS